MSIESSWAWRWVQSNVLQQRNDSHKFNQSKSSRNGSTVPFVERRKHCLTLYFGCLSVRARILECGSFSAVLATIFERCTCFGANEPHSNMLCARQSCNARHNPVSFSLFLFLIYDYLFLNTASYYCNQTYAVLHKRAAQASKTPIVFVTCYPTQAKRPYYKSKIRLALLHLVWFCVHRPLFFPPPILSLRWAYWLHTHEICFLCSRYSRCAGSCPCLQGGMWYIFLRAVAFCFPSGTLELGF